jgi:hypothetical protein
MPDSEHQEKPTAHEGTLLSRFQQTLDLSAKIWVPLIAAIYGCGYVVISIYHASLGLNEINLPGPKTAAAGILFLVFFGIALCVLQYLGGPIILPYAADLQRWPRLAFLNSFGVAFILNADLLAAEALSIFIHFDANSSRPPRSLALVIVIRMVLFSGMLFSGMVVICRCTKLSSRWTRHWLTWCCCGIDIAVLGVVSFPWHGQFDLPQLAWVLALTQYLTFIAWGVFKPEDENWLFWASPLILLPLLFYSIYVYPHIRGAYGGSEPANARIFLAAPSGTNPAKQFHARIIDETDNGFYVIENGHTEVRFIPRSQVNAIEFDKPSTSPL